jgi:hypothetical protein
VVEIAVVIGNDSNVVALAGLASTSSAAAIRYFNLAIVEDLKKKEAPGPYRPWKVRESAVSCSTADLQIGNAASATAS